MSRHWDTNELDTTGFAQHAPRRILVSKSRSSWFVLRNSGSNLFRPSSTMSVTAYELSVDSWATTDRIVIRSPSRQVIGLFPVPFLRTGGDNSWEYVSRVLRELIDLPELEAHIIVDRDGLRMREGASPLPGEYTLVPAGRCGLRRGYEYTTHRDTDADIRFTRGPEYFRRGQAPHPEGSTSTRSDSKRSSVNQVRAWRRENNETDCLSLDFGQLSSQGMGPACLPTPITRIVQPVTSYPIVV